MKTSSIPGKQLFTAISQFFFMPFYLLTLEGPLQQRRMEG